MSPQQDRRFEPLRDICYNRSIMQFRKAHSVPTQMTASAAGTAAARPTSLRTLLWLLAAALLIVSAAGCQRTSQQAPADQAPEIGATLIVDPDPALVGPASVMVRISGAGGTPIEGASVSLKGDMSHAGMQPVLADAAETAGGVYEAQWVWTMSGDWFVTVTASLPDGRTLVRRFDLTVRRP